MEAAELRAKIDVLKEELALTRAQVEAERDAYESTRGWRALTLARRVHRRVLSVSTVVTAPVQSLIGAGSPARPPRRPPDPVQTDLSALRFETTAAARVSIIIPTYNHRELVARCLLAIRDNTGASYEVIVVDDGSTDGTREKLSSVPGLTLIHNAENLGFVASVMAGAEAAGGEFLLFLNNDTEVQPGWLEPLLRVMDADATVGAAGSKLLFPDGRLQEAGSVIWDDGSGANLGHGADPDLPEYNHLREVDYCSGAALMVRCCVFDEVGGFDPRFTPGYYEDTDLCFALRAWGYRVVYVPRSTVVHAHGSSFGSETGKGAVGTFTKTAMHVNRVRFVDKWKRELDRQLPSGTVGPLGGRRDRRPRVLVCDYMVPAHDRESGGLRMTWIIRLLVQAGCAVSLLPRGGERLEPYTGQLQDMGIEVLYGPRAGQAELLRSRAGWYDLALLSRPGTGSDYLRLIRSSSPSTFIVYDTVDLHHVREERRLALYGEPPNGELIKLRDLEWQLIRRSDLVATVSADEAEVVTAEAPGMPTIVLPNVHEPVSGEIPGFAARGGLLFIGGFNHEPNLDAIGWFVEEILPLVRARTEAKLTIVGADPPEELLRLNGPDVIVTGHVPDVDEYFRSARVFVAPLRYGAGVKGKVGQAMSYGLPIVMTGIGAEGIGAVDGVHALIRNQPEPFAEAVASLLISAEQWYHLSTCSRELVSRFRPEAMSERLREMLRLAGFPPRS